MRQVVGVVFLLLALTGCAGTDRLSTARRGDDAGVAAPGPGVVGTWSGTAFAVPGSAYLISVPIEVTIHPDGTWRWTSRGHEQGSGRARMAGDRVVLDESKAAAVEEPIQLQRRGDTLWGISRAFIQGAVSAVELRRAGS
jgi:hypothetical protein